VRDAKSAAGRGELWLLDALAGARTVAAAGTTAQEQQRILAPLAALRSRGDASWRIQARAAAQGVPIAPVLRDGQAVLSGLDLTVPGGCAVAVVGRSRSGKSTLASLAGRLIDPDWGEITLDGLALRQLTRAALRDAIVYAFERPLLIGQTPFEAISFGAFEPSRDQVLAAAAHSQASRSLAAAIVSART
jgi:ATP-binding cassette subfamily B protein